MKKFLKSSLYVSLLAAAMVFTSCQKETYEVEGQNTEGEALMATSATAKLMERTVSNDGSYDNIVDGASCFDIRFPYTVSVNGLDITIDSKEDLHLIEEIFDAVEGDDDLLDIIFPITITMADYTDITINGEADLRELAEQCIEGGDDDDIECIDVVYPVTFYTLDTTSTQTGSVVVESDRDMRRFFAGLGENDLISIQFPVVFVMYDGVEVRVGNNAELAEAIELAKDICDEDDDNDYNDDDFTKERLDNLLVECPWLIRDVMRDAQLQTDQYYEYIMNFSEDGAVNVIDRNGNNITGTWSTRVSDYRVLLKLEFDILVDFNLEWFVYEISKEKIKLHTTTGNHIIMENACDILNGDPNTLREILRECSWVIKKVIVNDVEIRRLLGYEFNFMAEGMVTLSNGDVVSNGTWEITTNAQGRLVLAVLMGDEPGVSFEWPLTDLRDDRLKFEIPGTDYALILQRVCDDNANDGDVVEIRNTLMQGNWGVSKFVDDGKDETANFTGFNFDFQTTHMINATAGVSGPTYPGVWRVLRNSDGKLKVYLNLGEEDPLGDLTDDWDFVSISENRIELRDISGGNGGIDTLVFEKI